MKRMKISILIPCYNEERSIRNCLEHCLLQTRPADEIVVVDDASTDLTREVVESFGNKVKLVKIGQNTGNKSYVQEIGLKHITGDIFIATDADTLLQRDYVKQIESDFMKKDIAAVAGYVESLKYNWITACRELEYVIGQDIHKLAQHRINALLVIPGCAGAFRTELFRQHISFDHDTVTEDLDFTYKLHRSGLPIYFNRKAIVYTQDPSDISSYINQMRRWYGGGWQNFLKHYRAIEDPAMAIELTLVYGEGLIFSLVLLLLPFISLKFFSLFLLPYLAAILFFGLYAAIRRKRIDLFYYAPLYIFLCFINSTILVEQFVKEVLLQKKNLAWFHPPRMKIQKKNLI